MLVVLHTIGLLCPRPESCQELQLCCDMSAVDVWKLLFRREGTVGSMLRYLYCLVYLAVGWCIGYDLYSAERRMKHPLW